MRQQFFARLLVFALLLGASPFARAAHGAESSSDAVADNSIPAASLPLAVTLPSPQPSGLPTNDTLYFSYYAPTNHLWGERAPAILLLPYLGSDTNEMFHEAARYVAARGIAAVVVTLPYHGQRAVPGISPYGRFMGTSAAIVAQSFSQSVADVRAVTDWLMARPEIDTEKLACVGISLGALITHLAMGQDARLKSGVALLGTGDLATVHNQSLVTRLMLGRGHKKLTKSETTLLNTVDPLTFASQNRPRRVWMIQAGRDAFLPPQTSEKLWRALGKPPITWLDTNHFALNLSPRSTVLAAIAFLEALWHGASVESAVAHSPKITVPTLKAGFLMGMDSRVTPALQYQALTLGRWNHMALLSANLGLSGRGAFVSLAATVNPFIDIGLAHRLSGGKPHPYTSFHVVF